MSKGPTLDYARTPDDLGLVITECPEGVQVALPAAPPLWRCIVCLAAVATLLGMLVFHGWAALDFFARDRSADAWGKVGRCVYLLVMLLVLSPLAAVYARGIWTRYAGRAEEVVLRLAKAGVAVSGGDWLRVSAVRVHYGPVLLTFRRETALRIEAADGQVIDLLANRPARKLEALAARLRAALDIA